MSRTDAMQSLRSTHERKRDEEKAAKRAAWDALQSHCPEFAERVPQLQGLAQRFGGRITGVAVHADTTTQWGDLDIEDRQWLEGL